MPLRSCIVSNKFSRTRATSLQWRHNGRDSVLNHRPHDCLLNRLFRRRSKKTSKLRVTDLCAANSPGTGEFPAQKASNRKMFPFADVIMLTPRPLAHHHHYYHYYHCYRHCHLDGLVQEIRNSIANAPELRLFLTNPSILCYDKKLPWNLLFIRQTIIYGSKGFSYLFNRYNFSQNISLKNRCVAYLHVSHDAISRAVLLMTSCVCWDIIEK